MTTIYNKSSLSTFFEQGDIPQGSDYQNLIYSQVNIAETAEQDMAGPLYTTKLITPRVSAPNANITTLLSANVINVNIIGAGVVDANNAVINFLNVTFDVSANNGTVYSSASRSTQGYYSPVVIISAAGTALATATPLIGPICRVQGATDGQATGVKLLSGVGIVGWEQTIINEAAVSANLWPAGSDFRINALTSGAAFGMLANTTYIAVYTRTSGYAVK